MEEGSKAHPQEEEDSSDKDMFLGVSWFPVPHHIALLAAGVAGEGRSGHCPLATGLAKVLAEGWLQKATRLSRTHASLKIRVCMFENKGLVFPMCSR